MNLKLTGLLIALAALPPAPDVAQDGAGDAERWRRTLLEERATRDERFRDSPTSFLAGIAHLRWTQAAPLFLAVSSEGVSLTEKAVATARVQLTPDGEAWVWKPLGRNVTASLRGASAQPGLLVAGMLLKLDRFTVQVWAASEENFQAGVFDPERAALGSFKGLVYYAPEGSYRLAARIERLENPARVQIATTGEARRPFYQYARIHFSLHGESLALTAYKERLDGRTLFVPFRDATAGKATYGAGRFVTLDEPEGDALELDFNRAANFPCAYAPAFMCPLPPKQNWLGVSIEAGEKTYHLPVATDR